MISEDIVYNICRRAGVYDEKASEIAISVMANTGFGKCCECGHGEEHIGDNGNINHPYRYISCNKHDTEMLHGDYCNSFKKT